VILTLAFTFWLCLCGRNVISELTKGNNARWHDVIYGFFDDGLNLLVLALLVKWWLSGSGLAHI
jgi:hypothetical protein